MFLCPLYLRRWFWSWCFCVPYTYDHIMEKTRPPGEIGRRHSIFVTVTTTLHAIEHQKSIYRRLYYTTDQEQDISSFHGLNSSLYMSVRWEKSDKIRILCVFFLTEWWRWLYVPSVLLLLLYYNQFRAVPRKTRRRFWCEITFFWTHCSSLGSQNNLFSGIRCITGCLYLESSSS